MGRGKKKGKKEEQGPPPVSLAPLTISESPTTSETVVNPVDIVPDPGGRTGNKETKKSEKPAEAMTVEKPTTSQQKVEEKKEEPEVDDGCGLGLGGGRKKNPRKKKKQGDATPKTAETASVSAKPISTSDPSTAPPAVQQAPVASHMGPPPQPWGAGRGRETGPFAQPSPIQTPLPVVQQVPVASPMGPPSQTWGAGRGRGPGGEIGPAPVPIPPGFGALAPGYNRAQPTASSASRPSSQVAPGYSGDTATSSAERPAVQSASTPKTGVDMPLCRYKIPDKIIGRSVSIRLVKVLTNYLPMTIKPLKVNRYDVSFKPDKPKKFLPVAFNAAKAKLYPTVIMAFDQMKNCYTLLPLKNVTAKERFATNVEIKDSNGRSITFEVSFKHTGVVDLCKIIDYIEKRGSSLAPPTEAIQCIDVILRQATLAKYVKAGRQFFKRPAEPCDLGEGLEMWTGLFQSAIFTTRAFINVDVAHKGFPKYQPLIDALSRDFGLDLNRPIDQQLRGRDNFKSFIKGLRVLATIYNTDGTSQQREFICNDVVNTPENLSFIHTDPNGKDMKITVFEYYRTVKRYRIKYPKLNCMWVGPRDKNIYYPMELLHVAYGQARMKQLTDTQLSKMVTMAATPPDVRKHKIEEIISDMKYSKNPEFKHFGLEISDEFFPVTAKVLQPPILQVGKSQTVMPRNGVWRTTGLLKPEALQSWGFIAIETDPRSCEYEKIITMIMDCGRQMGMTVDQPKMHHFNVRMQDLQNLLFEALQKEIKFLFVIVSTRGKDHYHRVKQLAEREVGILTQCIKEYTAVRRMNFATVQNILLKVNSKLMGINQALDGRSMPACLKGGGVMIVGADVTHPSPDQVSVPSIAAVTASIDPKCYIYNIELSIQTPKKEMIVQFEDMMVDHLMVYKKHQGCLPNKIFVFRDGVSEGQFAQVMNSELTGVHRAYQRMTGNNKKPEVLFLLVQKRHHTRLFQTPNTKYNVEPGTVVDTDIVHARELDFYLVSHQAIKGTARPTRYHAVCNDGGIPHDEVEQLTYYLCHLYSRCMRAVSYPTPTYYAHLACLRARSLTFGEKFDNEQLERNPKRLHVLKKMLEFSRMFFV